MPPDIEPGDRDGGPMTPGVAVTATLAWFETTSGWAPPDPDTLAEWLADGGCRCPDGCWVASEAWCEHGLASWQLVLRAIDPRPPTGTLREEVEGPGQPE